jgi:transposase-like protein
MSRRNGGDDLAMTGQPMARARSLTEFQEAFPDEAGCAAFLFERRWPGGFVCPACGKDRAAILKSRAHTYECLDCGRQTSLTAGTVMHRSKLPLTAWFWAAHLMSTHSNGMSARQLEDQLGLTYKTAWLLAQKLRRSMVDPDREALEGVVEVDQAEIPFRAGDSFFDPGNAEATVTRGWRTPTGPMPVITSRSGGCPCRTTRLSPVAVFRSSSGLQINMLGEEFGHLGLDRLGRQGPRSVAQHLGERVGE